MKVFFSKKKSRMKEKKGMNEREKKLRMKEKKRHE